MMEDADEYEQSKRMIVLWGTKDLASSQHNFQVSLSWWLKCTRLFPHWFGMEDSMWVGRAEILDDVVVALCELLRAPVLVLDVENPNPLRAEGAEMWCEPWWGRSPLLPGDIGKWWLSDNHYAVKCGHYTYIAHSRVIVGQPNWDTIQCLCVSLRVWMLYVCCVALQEFL